MQTFQGLYTKKAISPIGKTAITNFVATLDYSRAMYVCMYVCIVAQAFLMPATHIFIFNTLHFTCAKLLFFL